MKSSWLVHSTTEGGIPSKSAGRLWVLGLGVAGTGLYAWFAGGTTPFTRPAEVMTAVPLIIAAGVASYFALSATMAHRPARSVSWLPAKRLWTWLVALGAFAVWELFCYLELPRFQHPTLSSLYDTASRWHPVKAALFFGWLALGWALVRSFGGSRN